jgi:hypothetical protein
MKKFFFIFIFFITRSLQAQQFTQLFETALALHKQNPQAALDLFEQALALNPTSVETHYNMAYVLKNIQQVDQAIAHYNAVLAQQPNNASAHIGKAQACLLLGDYIQGWKELEWRLGGQDIYTQELINYLAQGGSLKNKKIVLRAEWGAGDTIMLIRYAQLLHTQGAYVMVHLLHESLIPLFKLQPYLDEVVGPAAPCPPFHFQIPMMSLPRIFNTTVDTIPADSPYLKIPESITEKWSHLFSKDAFNIGICWQGNTIHGQEKFMPLEYFTLLAQIPSVKLYSLQQHHGLDQIKKLKDSNALTVFDATFDQTPFFDTISVMKNLDLIITVDTSIAHLAGALNVPVWVILPLYADWRWMLDRTDSPFYPSMRLFRQKEPQNWEIIIDQINSALKEVIQKKRT